MLRTVANKALAPLGLKLIPKHHDELLYQHDYGAGGYAKYREEQISANKRKFDRVFADETTLTRIADDILESGLAREGMCHGARNGWEVEWLRKRLNCPVIGTDISDSANSVPNMVCHDFHDPNPEWAARFSFVYTNSLDQAFDPRKALDTWSEQLIPDGLIYIEHTMLHSPLGASAMDPFGAHPMIVPYLLHEWGRPLERILHVEAEKGEVWVFVVTKRAG